MKEKINAFLSKIRLRHLLYSAALAHLILVIVHGVIAADYFLVLFFGARATEYMEIEYYSWIVLPTAISVCMMLPLHIEIITFRRTKIQGKLYGNSVLRCLYLLIYIIVLLLDLDVRFFFLSTSLLLIWPTTGCSYNLRSMRKSHSLRSKNRKRTAKLLKLSYILNAILLLISLSTLSNSFMRRVFEFVIDPLPNYIAFLIISMIICGIVSYTYWVYGKEDIQLAKKHSESESTAH